METKLRTTTTVNFVPLNVVDDYNKYMNQVDTADQLGGHDRPDHKWFRVRKWWWSIFLWAFGVVCVNAYMIYKEYLYSKGGEPDETNGFLAINRSALGPPSPTKRQAFCAPEQAQKVNETDSVNDFEAPRPRVRSPIGTSS